MAATVSAQCHNIIKNLQSVISFLTIGGEPSSQVDQKQVVDELERFSLWVGNIGAAHLQESSLSLESRLREASDVLEFVAQLLEDLIEVAGELLAIASGERVGESAAPSGDTEDETTSDEVTGLLEEIGACISRLFRVTSLIRQAGPTDTFAKALSRSRYLFSNQYDIAHVGEKFPKLAKTENSWLKARLGRAITHRRRYLSYIHNHHEKLEGHHHNEDMPKEKPHVLMTATQPDTSSRPSTFFTKASSLVPGRITPQMLAAEDQSDAESDAKSYTTISRSVAGDLDTSAISKIPKLDEMRTGTKKEFECPFCYRVKKFKNERVWRQHVFADLRSYVCTFPSCEHPYFSDMNDWFRHELQHHRVVYRCHVCNDRKFELGERYIRHVRIEHPDMFNIGEEQQILDMARRPLDQIRAQDCPCCSEWVGRLTERAEVVNDSSDPSNHTILVDPTVFKRHLASHLEQLALFAVPPGSKEGDANSDAAVEEDANTASSNLGLSSLVFTENNRSPKSSNGTVRSAPDTLSDANDPQEAESIAQSQQSQISHDNVQEGKKGSGIDKTYDSQTTSLRYKIIDNSYRVRDRRFFERGRVFSVLMKDPADRARDSSPTDYNSSKSLHAVEYGDNRVNTSVRTLVCVRSRRECCYALLITTYSGRATTERGIIPSEHGIAYEWGKEPRLVHGEIGITKRPIAIVMAEGCTLFVASRINYGMHHLVQYEVESKEMGYVHGDYITHLMENMGEEDVNQRDNDQEESKQGEGNSEHYEYEHDVRGFPREFEEGAKVMMRVSETRMKMFTVAAANRLNKRGWQYQLKMDNSILWNEGSWIGEEHLRRARESDWVDSKSAKSDHDGGELGRLPREISEQEEDDRVTRTEEGIEDEEPKGMVEQATHEGPAHADTEEPERNMKTNKTEEHLTSHQSNPGLQKSDTTEMEKLLTPEIEASYSTIIDDILRTSDLKTISSKRIRHALQERIGHDISDHKEKLGKLIMGRFDVIIAIDELLGTSDLDTISAKRMREDLQEQIHRDVSIEKDQVTEVVKERFEKIRAENSSIKDSRETALPVTTGIKTSDGDPDVVEAQREATTAGSVQRFEIGEEVDIWIGGAQRIRFTVATASQNQNTQCKYQLRATDGKLWREGEWISEYDLLSRIWYTGQPDLKENVRDGREKEEDELEGDEDLFEQKQHQDPAFREGAEVTIVAFDDAVLSPVFFVVASRYIDPDWYYQLEPLSEDDPHDREKWIPEEKIKFCGPKARTFDRDEDVQERGDGKASEGGEENLIDERDNSTLDAAGRRIPFEYDRWQTSGHQGQDDDTQDEDTVEGEQPEWADAQLGEEPEYRTEEDFVRWKEQMSAKEIPAKGVDDASERGEESHEASGDDVEYMIDERGEIVLNDAGQRIPLGSTRSPLSDDDDVKEDRRREIEHQQPDGTTASASKQYATPLDPGSSQGGGFNTASTPDYSGVGYDKEPGDMRHRDPARSTDNKHPTYSGDDDEYEWEGTSKDPSFKSGDWEEEDEWTAFSHARQLSNIDEEESEPSDTEDMSPTRVGADSQVNAREQSDLIGLQHNMSNRLPEEKDPEHKQKLTRDTPIVIKVLFCGEIRKFELPLGDLSAYALPAKLCSLLQVGADEEIVFERYSDSSRSWITLDADEPKVYKTLFRAAKAKLKLRLRATVVPVLQGHTEQDDLTSRSLQDVERPSGHTNTSPPPPASPQIESEIDSMSASRSPIWSIINSPRSVPDRVRGNKGPLADILFGRRDEPPTDDHEGPERCSVCKEAYIPLRMKLPSSVEAAEEQGIGFEEQDVRIARAIEANRENLRQYERVNDEAFDQWKKTHSQCLSRHPPPEADAATDASDRWEGDDDPGYDADTADVAQTAQKLRSRRTMPRRDREPNRPVDGPPPPPPPPPPLIFPSNFNKRPRVAGYDGDYVTDSEEMFTPGRRRY